MILFSIGNRFCVCYLYDVLVEERRSAKSMIYYIIVRVCF